ncbi:metal-dependent hydrolase [Anaerospora sp.]|jgi:inner membrane protein|uniref:metal-dependent hydrolase n=1 Tax=Anaerospora sp. TaxID=1960278 RepID=UPI002896D0BE|nr:metal-dependent hydrolase [Anaerospora sp.]
MDALTHGVVGIALAGLSGQPLAIDNPIYIAAFLGSQAPDFDFLAIIRGEMSYLKQHRAASHSLPGIVGWAALIAMGVFICSPESSFFSLFLWAFAGGLSHIALDFFNTHGAALLWPLRKERLSCNLLNVFDPLLLIVLLLPYMSGLPMQQISLISFSCIFSYIGLRLLFRVRATHWLKQHIIGFNLKRILVMPSLARIFYWDFVLETDEGYLVGEIGAFHFHLSIKANLPKQQHSTIMVKAQKTNLAEFFLLFTPFSYFSEDSQEGSLNVRIYDLRYFQNHRFLHSGTIIFNDENIPAESYLHSYGRKLKFPS